MKRIAGVVLVGCACGLAAVAQAAPAERPAAVFGEAVAAPLAGEQPRWASMLAAFGLKGVVPPVEALLQGLGRPVGVSALDGLDRKRPVALVLLDPRRFQRPLLLVAEVAAEKTFATATAAAADVEVKRSKRVAVLGAADAIQAAGDYAAGRLRAAPAEGVRARVFVDPVWAAYGGQAQVMKAVLVAQGGTPQSPMPPATIGRIFDGFVAGVEQSRELSIELAARHGGIDLVLSLLVKNGTAMDIFAGQQQPADFSLIGHLADQPYSLVAGGRVNLAAAGDALAAFLFGGTGGDPKLKDQVVDWMKLASGEIGMLGQVTSPSKMDYQYLLRTPDAARFAAAFPRMIDAMNQSGFMEGMARIARTEKPRTTYDGLTVSQSELHYDLTRLPSTVPGEKKFTLASAWTSWDDTIAMANGTHAADRIKQLVDAARHGKGAWQPGATIRAAVERARAARESFFLRMDLGAMSAATGQKTALPPGLAPIVSLGAAPHTMWMRVSVAAPPETAGSL